MKTLVYMIRHGESEGNAVHSFLGHTDLPLTERGRGQARDASVYLEKMGIRPDVAYASPLCRAYETATLALSLFGTEGAPFPIFPEKDVREIYAGKWENMYMRDIQAKYTAEFDVWRTDIGNACTVGGETVRELAERVRRAVLRIAAENGGKTVFIGTHATPIRTFEVFARGLSMDEAHTVPWPSNASLSAYLCEGERVTPLFYSLDGYLTDAEDTAWMGR
jgi:broad specificity phosphatase PhoE